MKFKILIALISIWIGGWMVHLYHFNSKFNDCTHKWEAAHRQGNYPEMEVFVRCQQLANDDTMASPVWFVLQRWNADYEAEARTKD